jgi:uncharacterized membrane protein YqjE
MANSLDRSFSEVIENIIDNVQRIIRSEVRLAKVEIQEETSKAGKAAIVLAAGVVFGLYALGFLLLSGVYGLSQVMPSWLAALAVGVVVAVGAAACIMIGRQRLKNVNPKPEKTIQTMKENLEWAKNQTK